MSAVRGSDGDVGGWRGRMMRRFGLLAILIPLSACASAQAKAPVEPAPLAVPPVPPRVIEPLPSVIPALEPVEELGSTPDTPPASPRTRPQPPRDATRPEPKPEPKPETPPEPAPQPPPAPVAPLRTPGAAEGPDATRQVTDQIGRARTMLDSIDQRGMSDERKRNYDSARSFLKQAEDALKAGNLVLAKSLADQAVRLAQLLGGRQNPD